MRLAEVAVPLSNRSEFFAAQGTFQSITAVPVKLLDYFTTFIAFRLTDSEQ
jgi:hypothetical protein